MANCLNCSKETTNIKFCSSNCAASYNNKLKPKRKLLDIFCVTCNVKLERKSFKDKRRKYCDKCNPLKVDWNKITFSDVKGIRNYQKNSRIRQLARKTYLNSLKPKKCMSCGYDKYFEVCHIKAIHSFKSNNKISTINSLKNLIALCPNCHWEFDTGQLTLDFLEFDNLHS